jgi:ABC-type phosphate transport system ATPase subunit
MTTHSDHTITLNELSPFYGQRQAVLPVSMRIEGRQITAVIGPSGCGKSTLLRCLNRMHETAPGAHATGSAWSFSSRWPCARARSSTMWRSGSSWPG